MVNSIISSIGLMEILLDFYGQNYCYVRGTVNAETFKHSKEYFFWISLGIPFYMFGQGCPCGRKFEVCNGIYRYRDSYQYYP